VRERRVPSGRRRRRLTAGALVVAGRLARCLPPAYRVVLLKNEFGDIEGANRHRIGDAAD
jgi:hypothetical protein